LERPEEAVNRQKSAGSRQNLKEEINAKGASESKDASVEILIQHEDFWNNLFLRYRDMDVKS